MTAEHQDGVEDVLRGDALTLRDRLALAALHGLLTNPNFNKLWTASGVLEFEEDWYRKVSEAAYRLGDELLAARAPKAAAGKRSGR